jgi:hypothetical protein
MRAPASLALALTVVMVAAACHVGPDVAGYPPASSPYGVIGSFVVGKATFEAELLAVRDSSFVLLRDRQVVELPFAGIASSSFAHVDTRVSSKTRPSPEELAKLRILSHFPQGLSAELERKLLESYGQTAPMVLGK